MKKITILVRHWEVGKELLIVLHTNYSVLFVV